MQHVCQKQFDAFYSALFNFSESQYKKWPISHPLILPIAGTCIDIAFSDAEVVFCYQVIIRMGKMIAMFY